VVDTHEGNWIEQGVNIWDGGYHELFPFDLHVANTADNAAGHIEYRMGYTQETILAPGTLATIRFRVKRRGRLLALSFDPEHTAVRFLGEDLLGDPEDEEDGAEGVVLNLPPARPASPASGRPIS
jgi:hypothetical protein